MARTTALKAIGEAEWKRIERGLSGKVARELQTVRRQLRGGRDDREAARAKAKALLLLCEIAQAE
jgi:hypothetical protein